MHTTPLSALICFSLLTPHLLAAPLPPSALEPGVEAAQRRASGRGAIPPSKGESTSLVRRGGSPESSKSQNPVSPESSKSQNPVSPDPVSIYNTQRWKGAASFYSHDDPARLPRLSGVRPVGDSEEDKNVRAMKYTLADAKHQQGLARVERVESTGSLHNPVHVGSPMETFHDVLFKESIPKGPSYPPGIKAHLLPTSTDVQLPLHRKGPDKWILSNDQRFEIYGLKTPVNKLGLDQPVVPDPPRKMPETMSQRKEREKRKAEEDASRGIPPRPRRPPSEPPQWPRPALPVSEPVQFWRTKTWGKSGTLYAPDDPKRVGVPPGAPAGTAPEDLNWANMKATRKLGKDLQGQARVKEAEDTGWIHHPGQNPTGFFNDVLYREHPPASAGGPHGLEAVLLPTDRDERVPAHLLGPDGKYKLSAEQKKNMAALNVPTKALNLHQPVGLDVSRAVP